MKTFLLIITMLPIYSLGAQELDSIMQEMYPAVEESVFATFKSPKLVLLQTNETQKKHALTFWIGHRFGDIGGEYGGSRTLFGLDAATDIHLGLDYGITDDLTVGIGRSRFDESYNFLGKYRLLHQEEMGIPVSVTLFAQSSWITRRENYPNEFPAEFDRINHFYQVIVARKFSPSLSLMINPAYLVRPVVSDAFDKIQFLCFGYGRES